MANEETKVVKTMAEEIVRAINTLVDKNNKRYVNNQIKNYVDNSSYGGSSSGGGALPGTINASQVRGLYNTVAGYIIGAYDAAKDGSDLAGKIISTMTGITSVQLKSATLEEARVKYLNANIGNFIHLIANHATIEDIDTEAIYSDIADIGIAHIGQAKIDWGQIDYLTSDTAIFHEIVGGRLIIDNLVVSEMITKDTNGEMVRIKVNQDGTVTSETVTFDGNDILNSGSTNGAVLIDNTVNGTKLVAESVTADKIKVSSLFANEADVGSISTYIINSKRIGKNLDLSENEDLVQTQSRIELTDRRLALILDGESTETQLILTDGMLELLANQVQVEVGKIDFSANDSITTYVSNQISGVTSQITQLDSKITTAVSDVNGLKQRVTSVEQTADSITSVVFDSETGASIVSQNAEKINWLVGTDEATSEMILTDVGLEAIADNIDLTANDTVRISSAVQISAEALADIDLTANGTIRQQAESISIIAGNVNDAKDVTDHLKAYYSFETEGLRTKVNNSKWSTLVKEDGFYIEHEDYANPIGAFHENTFEPQSILMGKIICKATSQGGWAWKVRT